MKFKLLLGILFIMEIKCVQSQIIITSSDFANIGTLINQSTDKTPAASITPGSSGENKVWDFTELQSDTSITIHYVDPASTPFANNFPQANMCGYIPDSMTAFVNKSNSSVQLLGASGDFIGNGIEVPMVFNNPETMITLPATYNTAFNDTSSYNIKIKYGLTVLGIKIDSARQKENCYITSIIDAWGTIKTPDGSFPCLRQNNFRHVVDSTWVKYPAILGGWKLFQSKAYDLRTYTYYINGAGYAFVNLKYYPDSTEVDWTRVNPTNLPQKEDTKIQIFQGENDEICINNIENKGIQVSLVDITGKLLYISSFNSNSIIKIPYQINKNCLYLVKIMDRDGHTKIVKYNKHK